MKSSQANNQAPSFDWMMSIVYKRNVTNPTYVYKYLCNLVVKSRATISMDRTNSPKMDVHTMSMSTQQMIGRIPTRFQGGYTPVHTSFKIDLK